MAALLWLSYRNATSRAEQSVQTLVDAALRRAERIFTNAEKTLNQLAEATGGQFTQDTAAILEDAVYNQHYFREAGLVDEKGMLVCTSFGPVIPPIDVTAEQKSDPALERMQILGVIHTKVKGEDSIVIALPTRGQGEVNVLLDPAQLVELFSDVDLGPNGSVAFFRHDGSVLAAIGRPPDESDRLPGSRRDIQVERASDRFGIHVAGRMSSAFALRDWRRDLLVIIPVGLACSAGLALLVMRLGRRAVDLNSDIRLAMRNDEFEAHYQPTIDTVTRRCAGAEVLIRWRHPDRGFVRPDLFIAMAEEGGLIEPMTEALMRRVVAEQADLFREYPQLHVGVNLAPEHFNSVMLLDKIPRIFSEASIPPDRLILEATERSLIKDTSATPAAVMQALRDMGATIALDDFGTGYSSLSYLHKFKFDYLKIDASFVRRIGTDNVSAGLIDSIIDLGKRLNVRLIAEGVETEQQFAYLASRGVHYVQGWLFAKALPPEEFRAYVRAHPPIKH